MYDNPRNHVDIKNIHKGLIGQTFYIRCPDDERYYKTVYISWNPWKQVPQVHMSNPVYGDPDPGTKSISAGMISQLQMQMNRAKGIC